MFPVKSHRPLLITAHPGHELLLHHWLEIQDRAVVIALTDGSGSTGESRTNRSRAIIAATGAEVGPVFGLYPDRQWYDAILNTDPAPFLAAVDRIVDTISREDITIVVDPVEHFNPMHDLAAVVGYLVGSAITKSGHQLHLATYGIEKAGYGEVIADISLDAAARKRKLAAVDSYYELAEEAQRVKAASSHVDYTREQLYAVDIKRAFPDRLAETPYYEQVGRARLQSNTYSQVITYDDHVRPLVMKLFGQTDEDTLLQCGGNGSLRHRNCHY